MLIRHILENETWLMRRILDYAKARGYTAYTSTLLEAWRVSIQGLSRALVKAMEAFPDALPEFTPGEDLLKDPCAAFGVKEAALHRTRGISLEMFQGLFKYYRYSFIDLVREMDADPKRKLYYECFVERFFDRVEAAFCAEWMGLDPQAALDELQQANRLMTNEKNKYLTLFESLDRPAFLVDENGLLDNMNLPAARMLGLGDDCGAIYYGEPLTAPGDARGKPLKNLLPWISEELRSFLSSGQSHNKFETKIENQGRIRFFSISFSRMRDVSGKFSGGVAVLEDVTERKELERIREDVERIIRHDLKAPLNAVIGVPQILLMDENLTEEQVELIKRIEASGLKMMRMIDLSMDMFKIETGEYTYHPAPVDLAEVIDQLIEQKRSMLASNDQEVRLLVNGAPPDPEAPFIIMSEDRLIYSLLSNLLANAIEASPPGERVTIELNGKNPVVLTIHNKGAVPKQVRKNFFDKYATYGKSSGTGLGTYTAKLMSKAMGYAIEMQASDKKNETLLTVVIPNPPPASGPDEP